MSDLKSEFLRDCEAGYLEAVDKLTQLEGLTPAQANWKPDPKRWSVSECLKHLNQTLEAYATNLDKAGAKLAAKRPESTEPTGRGTWVGRWLISAMDPAKAKKLKAGGPFKVAASDYDLTAEANDLRSRVDWMLAHMKNTDGLDSGKVKLRTPVFLKISLAQAFKVHSIHTLRHVNQALGVLKDASFPQ
ncbi:DinB family protein [Planctomycetota bacterium]|nr:DinB family protein [Planctomycetota bacterium]